MSGKTKEAIKAEFKNGLMTKGVDEKTAEHVAELAANSHAASRISDGNPVPGGCSIPGLFPG